MVVLEHGFEFDLGVSLGHFLEARFRGVIGIRVATAAALTRQLATGTLEKLTFINDDGITRLACASRGASNR